MVVDAYDANAAACKWAERYDADGADYGEDSSAAPVVLCLRLAHGRQ